MLQFINWKLQRNHTNVFNACIEGKSLHSLISTPANEKCARASTVGALQSFTPRTGKKLQN